MLARRCLRGGRDPGGGRGGALPPLGGAGAPGGLGPRERVGPAGLLWGALRGQFGVNFGGLGTFLCIWSSNKRAGLAAEARGTGRPGSHGTES